MRDPKAKIIPASRELLSISIEESTLYNRTDGTHVEMSLAFIDMRDPLLIISEFTPEDLEPGIPSQSTILSVEEAILLRDLLNRSSVAAILDATEEDRLKRCAGFSIAELDQMGAMYQAEQATKLEAQS